MSQIKVEYIQHMGSDLVVVNSARVSFGNSKTDLDEKDVKLIKYLADHEHMSPFESCSVTVKISCPLPISKQIMRHRTGSFNEISRRYTSKDLEIFQPVWREQAQSNRQASAGELEPIAQQVVNDLYARSVQLAMETYNKLLANGVSREQARMVLPNGLMTEFYMTMNLRNLIHFIKLREHGGAQSEVREVASQIKAILEGLFPVSTKALLNEVSK